MTLRELEAALRRGEMEALAAQLAFGDAGQQLLARALRREQYALEARPELSLATLQRVCVGTPELTCMLDAWALEWATAQRGAWLQALTPPRFALNSSLRRILPAQISAVNSDLPQSAQHRFKVRNDNQPEGFFSIEDVATSQRWLIENPAHAYFGKVIACGAQAFIVVGWCLDDDGIVARVDIKSQKIVWKKLLWQPVHQVTQAAPTKIYAEDSTYGYFIDVDSGDIVLKFFTATHGYAASTNGEFVTATIGGRLHEFDVAKLCAESEAVGKDARTSGLVETEFSSDGALLVVGFAEGRLGRDRCRAQR